MKERFEDALFRFLMPRLPQSFMDKFLGCLVAIAAQRYPQMPILDLTVAHLIGGANEPGDEQP